MSKTVSRVLYLTVIYLGGLLPDRSSHLLENGRAGLTAAGRSMRPPRDLRSLHGVAPDRVYSIGLFPADGCALTAPFHPYWNGGAEPAVYLCCTFPEVAFGGRYPLSLPCGARTFLMTGLSPPPRDCLSYSLLFYRRKRRLSTKETAETG